MKDITYKPTHYEIKQTLIYLISSPDIDIEEWVCEPILKINGYSGLNDVTGRTILTITLNKTK